MNNPPAQPDDHSGPLTTMKDILKWAGHTEGSARLENAYLNLLDSEIAANYIMCFPPKPGDQEK